MKKHLTINVTNDCSGFSLIEKAFELALTHKRDVHICGYEEGSQNNQVITYKRAKEQLPANLSEKIRQLDDHLVQIHLDLQRIIRYTKLL